MDRYRRKIMDKNDYIKKFGITLDKNDESR